MRLSLLRNGVCPEVKLRLVWMRIIMGGIRGMSFKWAPGVDMGKGAMDMVRGGMEMGKARVDMDMVKGAMELDMAKGALQIMEMVRVT